ncbi:hypothetical protein NL676_019777 [Syzygium grande]|nr:hypothetical protein NL676_019777 [Syzygium grande]
MSSHCHPGLVNCSLQQFASCSSNDITINQASAGEQPLGTPVFLVEMKNPGPSACTVSSVHFNCDSLSSDVAINPGIFKRVGDDDCLANNGTALPPVVSSVSSTPPPPCTPCPFRISRSFALVDEL